MEVARKNTDRQMMVELEHFQNQFIRQKEVIDETRNNVKQAENQLERIAHDQPIASDHLYFEDHTSLRETMNTFRGHLYRPQKRVPPIFSEMDVGGIFQQGFDIMPCTDSHILV